MGRARKQKHGWPLADGKGRVGASAAEDSIPRQARSALKRHYDEFKRKEARRGQAR